MTTSKEQAYQRAKEKVNTQKRQTVEPSGNQLEPLQNRLQAADQALANDLQVAVKSAVNQRQNMLSSFVQAAIPLFDGSLTEAMLAQEIGKFIPQKEVTGDTPENFCSSVAAIVNPELFSAREFKQIESGDL